MATLVSVKKAEQSPGAPVEIEVPASTAWPLVLAFGFTLMFAGLLTSASVSVLGVVLAVAGCVGWFREVFPHEHEEAVPIVFEDHRITTERRVVERVPVAPDIGWLKGRLGWRSSDGRAGLHLRVAEGRKHLVSHKPPCCYCLRGIP